MGGVIRIRECPFCGGPPVPIVAVCGKRGQAPRKDDYGDAGMMVDAYVFCHECGADGPAVEATVYGTTEYDCAERLAVAAWNRRNLRNVAMYDAGSEEGLNDYPRADDPRYTITAKGREMLEGK